MKATLTVKDGISDDLKAMIRQLDGDGRKKVLEVIGMALRHWAMEAFTDATMRPSPWKAKRDGTASTLQGTSPVLRRSLRVEATADEVSIGSDRPYALIHQVGGVIRPKNGKALKFQSGGKWWTVRKVTMPARPYLPVDAAGQLMPEAGEEAAEAAIATITAG